MTNFRLRLRKISIRSIALLAVVAFAVCATVSSPAPEHTLTFPKSAASKLGRINKLSLKVACGHISSIRNIPELYNINMGYEIPTENIFEAWPRLGAAAVELTRWNGVISVISESDDCFSVSAEAEDFDGVRRHLNGRQLGLAK